MTRITDPSWAFVTRFLGLTDVEMKPDKARDALAGLISTVEGTGGVYFGRDGLYRPVADPDWIDLGDVYALACAAFGREIKQQPDPDDNSGAEPPDPFAEIQL